MAKRKLSDIADSGRTQPVPEPKEAQDAVVESKEEIAVAIGNDEVLAAEETTTVTVPETEASEQGTESEQVNETPAEGEEAKSENESTTTTTEPSSAIDKPAEPAEKPEPTEKPAEKPAEKAEEPAASPDKVTPVRTAPASVFSSAKSSQPTPFGSTPGNPFARYSNFSFGSFGTPKSTDAKPASANPWAEPQSENKEETKPDETPIDTPNQKPDRYARVSLTAQHVENGEEEETAVFTSRARLYALSFKETAAGWKERGVGSLKLNIDTAGKARLVMRSDGLLRVILNLPLVENTTISKGFKSSLASEKFVRITGVEKDVPHQYAVKLKSGDVAAELYQALDSRIETKEDTESLASKSTSQAPSEPAADDASAEQSQEPEPAEADATQEVAAPAESETQTAISTQEDKPEAK